jgi:hypothetical protein
MIVCPFEQALKFGDIGLFWPMLTGITLGAVYLKTRSTPVLVIMALLMYAELAHYTLTGIPAMFIQNYAVLILALVALIIWWWFIGRRNT